ncbi:DUF1501 domain-containing protein [Acidiphilium sp. JA12-A1]|uniref:DUF1501 domain-containing protein n=1 Tax=Acidiphilium sp. JA12-A1 TaxID=1464546 RepID=UPI0004618513|nr:DUF1501 domain-containing protein [Acidiphilium sp. JA12-A1]KDM65391.1 hypothetical protein ACIDI_115c00090 [Acidiphilium sp. JA12-A1]
MNLSRRATLLGLATVATLGRTRLALAAAPTEARFVVVLLRGALDGMEAVIPHGDPDLARLRPGLVPQAASGHDLGGFYALHPALARFHTLYAAGELLAVHAIAGPYRTRSHFEAQDLLQTGVEQIGMNSGWLNRLIGELPADGDPGGIGLAAGIGTPLILRGAAPVGAYAPVGFAQPDQGLYAAIGRLNAGDPVFGPAIARGLGARRFDRTAFAAGAAPAMDDEEMMSPAGRARPADRYGFPELAARVGTLLAAEQGPRIAAFQLEGWDTHVNQMQLLPGPLGGLDRGVGALKAALGVAWAKTAVLVITEFGRTARINGTRGTDHGTATVAFLAGGAVQGGRVLATWPGLKDRQLFQNRDLAPTADLRALAKGVLAAQFGLGPQALARIFPESAAIAPMGGLLRA